MTITIGRRVFSFDDLELPGDYFLDTPERGLWFLLPIHRGGKFHERDEPGQGVYRITEPPWTFRECPDGSLEVRASILTDRSDENPNGSWHGYLDEGHVWRQV